MASGKGASRDGLDERLAAVRDSILLEGEKIVAQAEGDQGQAVVLTESRVLIIKAGLAATGTVKGQKTSAFRLDEITALNARRGPMGGVIQVCTDTKPAPGQGGPPDNIVVFGDPGKMKRCDAIVAEIEAVLGKRVEKIGPATTQEPESPAELPGELVAPPVLEALETMASAAEPAEEQPAQESVPILDEPTSAAQSASLADEICAEIIGLQEDLVEASAASPSADVETPAVEASVEPEIEAAAPEAEAPEEPEEPEDEEDPLNGFQPNPNLPKPVRRKRSGSKALVLLGCLGVVLLMGVAVVNPLRQTKNTAESSKVNLSQITRSASMARLQHGAVSTYREQVVGLMQESDSAVADLKSALASGNKQAITLAAGGDATDEAWRKLGELEAPAGLVEVKETLTAGMFMRKDEIAAVLGSLQSSGSINAQEVLSKLAAADELIQEGLGAITKLQSDLEARMSKAPG